MIHVKCRTFGSTICNVVDTSFSVASPEVDASVDVHSNVSLHSLDNGWSWFYVTKMWNGVPVKIGLRLIEDREMQKAIQSLIKIE